MLKSPASQRGRDFAIILSSLSELGYAVEWRVINAAEYGMPQRRRRVFLMGYHKTSKIYKKIMKEKNNEKWISDTGVLSNAFKVKDFDKDSIKKFKIEGELEEISKKFNLKEKNSPFKKAGIMINNEVWTFEAKPNYNGKVKTIGKILQKEKNVPEEFFIDSDSLKKWQYFKGAKKEVRFNKKHNFSYNYAEGSMIFPDRLDFPSRTIITSEGGRGPSRCKHVVKTESGRLRRLTPLELERLNMFPDNHTKEASDVQRAFLMGNALVVGVVERIGKSLMNELNR